jgi:hypothetical protein
MNKIKAQSEISRTNQLRISDSPEAVAKKLFQFLFKSGKGIESFNASNLDTTMLDQSLGYYQKQNKAIKHEIQKRLDKTGDQISASDIQYSLFSVDGKKFVFFLSPNKTHSGWIDFFQKDIYCRQKILNLVFKVYLLSKELPIETLSGFEELLLVHSMSNKSEKALFVWGQNLLVNYNRHHVLTLTLSRKYRLFLPKDDYQTLDVADIGETLVYKSKNYYFQRDLDARQQNTIYFMRFEKDDPGFSKFKKTQLYHYHNLMNELEKLLSECNIAYEILDFRADHYLENPFIKNIESVDSIEIINNTGTDFTRYDMTFLENVLTDQGVASVTFYSSGNTIASYEPVESAEEEKTYWKITELLPWTDVKLNSKQNYLVFNKLLDEETGSMAYRQADGLWNPSEKISDKPQVDFYSRLKRDHSYLETGSFISMQGINTTEFKPVGDLDSTWSILNCVKDKVDEGLLRQETSPFNDGKYLGIEDNVYLFVAHQHSSGQLQEFYEKYKIDISPELKKVIIELGIKNWIRNGLNGSNTPLLISSQNAFPEKSFFAIYVRSPRNQDAKAVAVEFLHKDGYIFIRNVMRDLKEIQKRFHFLRTKKNNSDKLIEQQLFVDEIDKVYISCYTDDYFTPMLIGRHKIYDDLEKGTLEVNRRKDNNILPLAMSYNQEIQQVKNLVCLDLANEIFVQYFVPPAQSLRKILKNGFRVYHMVGYSYDGASIPTEQLIEHPVAGLHFNTLTQNVLKISENSQSSLLQKIAKVFIEN